MRRQFASLLLGVVVLCGNGLLAQQTPPAPPSPPRGNPTPSPPARGASPVVDLSAGGQLVNVRLDISISDQAGPGPVQPKLLTLLLADRSFSQVRSSFDNRTDSYRRKTHNRRWTYPCDSDDGK